MKGVKGSQDHKKQQIRDYYLQGFSIIKCSVMFDCSNGKVHDFVRDIARSKHKTKGFKHTGEYPKDICKQRIHRIWLNLKNRCTNDKCPDSRFYKDKGIKYESKWEDFKGFLDDMYTGYNKHVEKYGETKTTIDRIDGNKGYTKENCRWATPTQQANNRSSNRVITIGKETKTLAQWARAYGFKSNTLRNRFNKHGSTLKALNI